MLEVDVRGTKDTLPGTVRLMYKYSTDVCKERWEKETWVVRVCI